MHSAKALFTSLLGFAVAVLADTCAEVASQTTVQISWPLSVSYMDEQAEYWSTSCSRLKPSCIIFPKTADEVAAVVKILHQNEEAFAIKSGGHNPNNYYASVEGGPLISTQKLDQVLLDQQTGIARIGPGNRLDGVAKALDGSGWTFVGGRIGNTGVGGLVLGGGLSYMSGQYGWAASLVLEYELVLANGSVVQVSATSHADLFKVLKGGGNNFGIVTTYVLQTQRQGDVWGGNLVFLHTAATAGKLLQAVRDFGEHNTDDRAAVIVTAERITADAVDLWIILLFYDGPAAPPGLFANFTSVGLLAPLVNDCRRRTYADLMAWSNVFVVPGANVVIGTETLPVPSAPHAAEVMHGLHAHWRAVSDTLTLVPGLIADVAYMPFPRRIAQEAAARGADVIEADADLNRLIIEVNYHFTLPTDYSRMDAAMQQTYGGFRSRVLDWQAQGKLPSNVYLPLFANYAFFRQDYWARLRPQARALARRVAHEVDPAGLFRDRTGGWKP